LGSELSLLLLLSDDDDVLDSLSLSGWKRNMADGLPVGRNMQIDSS
jgi:hypothetical protein